MTAAVPPAADPAPGQPPLTEAERLVATLTAEEDKAMRNLASRRIALDYMMRQLAAQYAELEADHTTWWDAARQRYGLDPVSGYVARDGQIMLAKT